MGVGSVLFMLVFSLCHLHLEVFGPDTEQADIFAEVEGLVQSALDGYKVRICGCCFRSNALSICFQ